jgi:hypothetical protein
VTSLRLGDEHGENRFPGFDVPAQAPHWDSATRERIDDRFATGGPLRFFSNIEAAAAGALFDQLLDQRSESRVPVLELVAARLAKDETDGWRYDTMPKADEKHGVVDGTCRSFAVSNLHFTDGSVLPTQGSANPALTIMAIAARTAGHLMSGGDAA